MNTRTIRSAVALASAVLAIGGALVPAAAGAQTSGALDVQSRKLVLAIPVGASIQATLSGQGSATGESTDLVAVDMREQLFVAGNAVRSEFGFQSLGHDTDLESAAQTWAERLVRERATYHQSGYFENIACGYGPISGEEVVARWMDEVPPNDGHGQNMLHSSITRVGYGFAHDASGFWCSVYDALW